MVIEAMSCGSNVMCCINLLLHKSTIYVHCYYSTTLLQISYDCTVLPQLDDNYIPQLDDNYQEVVIIQ